MKKKKDTPDNADGENVEEEEEEQQRERMYTGACAYVCAGEAREIERQTQKGISSS